MAEIGKRAVIAITNQIERLNNRLFHWLWRNEKWLEAMGVKGIVEKNRACLQEWIPSDW